MTMYDEGAVRRPRPGIEWTYSEKGIMADSTNAVAGNLVAMISWETVFEMAAKYAMRRPAPVAKADGISGKGQGQDNAF